jgi:AraC-like DNA-binding protein
VRAIKVAERLAMTERTMHRRLAEEGTSFSDIHESLCRDLAEKCLREEKLNLKKIAFLLGYSDQSAFSVAFKRWTGKSPMEFRAALG